MRIELKTQINIRDVLNFKTSSYLKTERKNLPHKHIKFHLNFSLLSHKPTWLQQAAFN